MATLAQINGNGPRLESWKEIAAYLKRDRRTVQRWEANEGLPVHRHVHESQSTVFAYPEELDAWLAGRLESPPSPELVESPPQPARRFPVWRVVGALALVSAVLVTTGIRKGWSMGIGNEPSEPVTAASSAALQWFAKASDAAKRGNWRENIRLSQEALAADPGMASAHLWLAWASKNLNLPEWEYEIGRARELEPNATERERLFIEASFHMLYKHEDLAIPLLETLTRQYPDHEFGWINLADAYQRRGRERDALDTLARLAELRPNDYPIAVRVAQSIYRKGKPRVVQYARRATVLMANAAPNEVNLQVPLMPFFVAWPQNAAAASKELDFAAEAGQFLRGRPESTTYSLVLSDAYLAMGQVRKARQWIDQIPDLTLREDLQAYTSYMANDLDDARARLMKLGKPRRMDRERGTLKTWTVWARLRPPDARLAFVEIPLEKNPLAAWFQGELALSEGKVGDAVTILTVALTKFPQGAGELRYQDTLADALIRAGDHQRAIAMLKEATNYDPEWNRSAVWVRSLGRLLREYRTTNRIEGADVEVRLRQLLATADSDFYQLKMLRP
ncbi:MAG: tetratricopeptide repeat protein [Acidobacteriota bacterium]